MFMFHLENKSMCGLIMKDIVIIGAGNPSVGGVLLGQVQ